MTASQSAQYVANTSFLSLIDANESIARSVPAFFRHTQTLRTLMAQAKASDTETKQDTKGLTKNKEQLKTDLYNEMYTLTNIVSGFAAEQKDNVLLNRVKSFTSVFGRTRQNEIAELCNDILDKVKPFLTDLADYGITADTLDAIQDLIDVFDEKLPATRTKNKEKKVSKQTRDSVFDEMTALMNQKILKVAVALQKTQPEFYNKIIATTTVDSTQTKPTQVRLVIQADKTKHDVNTLMARSMESDTFLTPNAKGEVLFKYEKSGTVDLEVPLANGEIIKLKGIKVRKGKTTRVVVKV